MDLTKHNLEHIQCGHTQYKLKAHSVWTHSIQIEGTFSVDTLIYCYDLLCVIANSNKKTHSVLCAEALDYGPGRTSYVHHVCIIRNTSRQFLCSIHSECYRSHLALLQLF